jgi:hypothetical protein
MYDDGVNINLYSTSGALIMIENTTYAMLNNESQPFRLIYRNCTYSWLNETKLSEIYARRRAESTSWTWGTRNSWTTSTTGARFTGRLEFNRKRPRPGYGN